MVETEFDLGQEFVPKCEWKVFGSGAERRYSMIRKSLYAALRFV